MIAPNVNFTKVAYSNIFRKLLGMFIGNSVDTFGCKLHKLCFGFRLWILCLLYFIYKLMYMDVLTWNNYCKPRNILPCTRRSTKQVPNNICSLVYALLHASPSDSQGSCVPSYGCTLAVGVHGGITWLGTIKTRIGGTLPVVPVSAVCVCVCQSVSQ